MSRIKLIIALFIVVSTNWAQNIKINGRVTDTGSVSVSGAVVKLEKAGFTTITGTDGAFMLTGTGINVTNNQFHQSNISASTSNGVLYLHLRERSSVEIVIYTLQGKVVSRVRSIFNMGTHRIVQPGTGKGVYLYRIKSGNDALVLKSPATGLVSGRVAQNSTALASSTTANLTRYHSTINDVIAVHMDGYIDYRVIVTSSDTSGIEIKLIVCADTIRDIDGNLYQAVQIGDQVWTVENLRTTKYNDGKALTLDTSLSDWVQATTGNGFYCYYSNTTNADSIRKYGALYNWYAVETKKLAPAGWHVPDTTDWNILEHYLIDNGYNWDGTTTGNKIAKSLAAKADWNTSTNPGSTGNDLPGNNRTGFSALPGGYRHLYINFSSIGNYGYYWSATQVDSYYAYYRNFQYFNDLLGGSHFMKISGLSVRLVRNRT